MIDGEINLKYIQLCVYIFHYSEKYNCYDVFSLNHCEHGEWI